MVTHADIGGKLLGFAWSLGDSLLIFLRGERAFGAAGGVVALSQTGRGTDQADLRWPPPGADSPGELVEGAASPSGLVMLAYRRAEWNRAVSPWLSAAGVVSVLAFSTPSTLRHLASVPLSMSPPTSLQLRYHLPVGESRCVI